MKNTTHKALVDWLVNGERGTSSETMCAVFLGKTPTRNTLGSHPHDPDDFKRCYRLLKLVPECVALMQDVAKLSPQWKNLVDNWSELEALFEEEYPQRSAPKLFNRIQELTQ